MTLKIRNAAFPDKVLSITNQLAVTGFKQKYIEELGADGADLAPSQLRMFAMGKELKDDLFIYSYDILNESTVQVMIRR